MFTNGEPAVVISGIGVVSPFGAGRERYWDHISRGVSGCKAITQFDASSLACRVAAWVPPVSIEEAAALENENGGGRADPKRYSRAALFGVVAAREAWRDAGLPAGLPNAGVLIGSGGGGIDVGEKQYEDFFASGGRHVTPYAIAIGICGMLSSEISIALQLRGLSHVLSCGCTSSTDAIGYAASLIRAGEYDAILSGGAEGCVLASMIFGFSRMRVVSTHYNDRPAEASRPFDRGRDGFVLGEGAWMLVIEREDRAIARGATRYARIEGYASTCDAYHRVQMDPDGTEIVRCIETALARARRRPEEIGYINYHGTSTQLNDAVESRCVRRVFGGVADRVPGSSTKSMIGHPQGASGAAGVVASALALTRGVLPPTINLHDPDPACEMDFIPNVARAADVEAALCNCLGFGSKNSVLVLGRAD
ncbi:MAG: hypothetical protein A3F70_02900 [Acidobacteria bacterium RIFCSPLOWO2_12_FULL_67_14]|nr:MAG: hypothetical protein A3H29_19175 [Acidobacteria bacterium RIFCSPLOWO2_02_FULL_67_21]OFW37114.1 MAG: hypothetical protein A3F70_02900 [Acidobacteria bacterium RIFCSPLOWO2_12_FULL_67_14]